MLSHPSPPTEETVNPNQELVALGAANMAAACSTAFRSAAARPARGRVSAGARSQLTPLVARRRSSCPSVAAGRATEPPQPILAPGDHAAVGGRRARGAAAVRVRRPEFVRWLAAFLGVALLGVLVGIFVAIVLSCRLRAPGLATLRRRARRERAEGLPRLERIPTPARSPGCCCTGSTPAVLRHAGYSGAVSRPGRHDHTPHPLGRGGGRAHHRRGHHRRRRPPGAARRAATSRVVLAFAEMKDS